MVDIKTINEVIKEYGFPIYLYEEDVIAKQVSTLKKALSGFDIYYSIKTNPNKHLCRYMSHQGFGADAASANEVIKAHEAGFGNRDILYSSPGKTVEDITNTLDKAVIVADSYNELAMINEICGKRGKKAAVGLRINPNFTVNMGAVPEIVEGASSKFGVDEESLLSNKNFINSLNFIEITGIHVYLRSQILDEKAIYTYFKRIFNLAEHCITQLNWDLSFIDFGGGFGIPYSKGDHAINWQTLQPQIQELVNNQKVVSKDKVRFIVESGRFLVSEAGTFLTKIVDVKKSRGQKFAIVHGGLNGFLRPSIMNIFRQISLEEIDKPLEPLFTGFNAFESSIPAKIGQPLELVSVVGNLCTSMDLLAKDVYLPNPQIGDILCINNAGAYSYTLSPYDFASHPRPREIYINHKGYME
jgi:diaminopimelate decarboxylase